VGPVRVVLLVLKRARNPDAAFLTLLRAFLGPLRQRGVALILCGVQPDLDRALASTGLDVQIGAGRLFRDRPGQGSNTREAFDCAYSLLDKDLCAACPRRQDKARADQPVDYVI
jgi:SulP family sulfate permease